MISKIETDAEYNVALSRVEELWNADLGTPKGQELDTLITLIHDYEVVHYPIDPPSNEAATRFRQEQEAMPVYKRILCKYKNAFCGLTK